MRAVCVVCVCGVWCDVRVCGVAKKMSAGEESELIAAAREQAGVALALADQVESTAGGNPQTQRTIAQLREAAQRVPFASTASVVRECAVGVSVRQLRLTFV